MQLARRFNEGIHSLLCVIDICCKHKWVVPLKGKNGINTTKPFNKIL